MDRPIVGITMGDPSGNGPELSVKARMNEAVYVKCRPVIIGDAVCLEEAKKVVTGAGAWKIHAIESISDAKYEYGTIDVLDLKLVDIQKRLYKKDYKKYAETTDTETLDERYSESARMCGECAFQYVKKVIELALNQEVDATVTNALNKEHINMAGHHYSGHTEIYAHYTNTPKYTMMLAHDNLRVVHVSTHVSLREACDRVKKARVLECIKIANAWELRNQRSVWQGSIRIVESMGCLEEKKSKKFSLQLMLLWRRGSVFPKKRRRRRILYFQRHLAAGMTLWWLCTMIRGIFR